MRHEWLAVWSIIQQPLYGLRWQWTLHDRSFYPQDCPKILTSLYSKYLFSVRKKYLISNSVNPSKNLDWWSCWDLEDSSYSNWGVVLMNQRVILIQTLHLLALERIFLRCRTISMACFVNCLSSSIVVNQKLYWFW